VAAPFTPLGGRPVEGPRKLQTYLLSLAEAP
jgi:hypothetical protein